MWMWQRVVFCFTTFSFGFLSISISLRAYAHWGLGAIYSDLATLTLQFGSLSLPLIGNSISYEFEPLTGDNHNDSCHFKCRFRWQQVWRLFHLSSPAADTPSQLEPGGICRLGPTNRKYVRSILSTLVVLGNFGAPHRQIDMRTYVCYMCACSAYCINVASLFWCVWYF